MQTIRYLFIQSRPRLGLAGALAAATLLACGAYAKEQQTTAPNSAKEFVQGALDASQLELKAGKLAQERAQHQSVKRLGKTMVEDHGEIRDRLEDLAEMYGVHPKDSLKPQHRQQWENLKSASRAEFDRVFVQHVIRDHQRDLAMLDRCANQFKDDTELQTLIDQQTPTVRKHLKMARNAAAELGLRDDDPNAFAEIDVYVDTDETRPARTGRSPAERNQRRDYAKKGDGEILGLPTSNNDGTILGLLPAPSRTVKAGSRESYIAEELADGTVDPDIENIRQADTDAVGAPSTLQRERAASAFVRENNLPKPVRQSLRRHGWNGQEVERKQLTFFETEVNGRTVYVTRDGKLYTPARNDK